MNYCGNLEYRRMSKGEDGKLWFWEIAHNSLYSWNFDDDIFIEKKLSCYDEGKYRDLKNIHHTLSFVYQNKIFLIPRKGNSFIAYDYMQNETSVIGLPTEIECLVSKVDCIFSAFYLENCYAYLAGGNIPYLVKLNLRECCVEKYINIFQGKEIIDYYLYFKGICVVGNKIIVCSVETNDIFVINKDDFSLEKLTVKGMRKGVSSVVCLNNKLIFFPRYIDPVVVWNIKDDDWNVISEYPADAVFGDETNRQYDFPILIENKIYIFPIAASDVLTFDIEEEKINIEQNINQYIKNHYKDDENNSVKCNAVDLIENKLIILFSTPQSIFVYDLYEKAGLYRKITFPENDMKKQRISIIRSRIDDGIIYENSSNELKDFIEYVSEKA